MREHKNSRLAVYCNIPSRSYSQKCVIYKLSNIVEQLYKLIDYIVLHFLAKIASFVLEGQHTTSSVNAIGFVLGIIPHP